METKNIRFSFSAILFFVFAFNSGIQSQNSFPSGWEFQTNTSNPHGIIVMLEANPRINNIPVEVGDYIGAFYTDDNGNLGCGGADFWLGDENIIFPIFGNDPDTPEKDGFSYNEQIYFKIFSVNNQKAYDVDQIAWSSEYSSTNHWFPLALSAMLDVVSYVDFDAFISTSSNPVCVDEAITLNANIFVGTTGSYTYSWTSEPAGLFSSATEISLTPAVNTTYFLEVSDGALNSSHALNVSLQEAPTIDAGADISICPTHFAQIQAQGQNFSAIVWSTQGDGSFVNQNGTNPKYYPGSADVEAGLAHIFATTAPMSGCSLSATDSLDVIIIETPIICLPAEMEFCTAQNIMLQAEAANYSSIFWTTTGDGTFGDTNSLATQYFPGAQDFSNGATSLVLCARPLIPLTGVVCSTLVITLIKAPTINAPTSLMRCDNQPITLNTIAANYAQLQWVTNGDGTFSNLHTTSTKYYPGVQDKITQEVQVSITAFGHEACTAFPANRSIQLTLGSTATAVAGADRALCQGQNLMLNAEVENYSAVVWSSTGDGFFTNCYIPNPVYYPGAGDIANGGFSMVLTVYPIYPCITTIIDGLDVIIVNTPEVEILSDDMQIFPLGQTLELQAEASGYQSLLWETSGDGTFDDAAGLNPAYTPGVLIDASGNAIVLSITAFASAGCGSNVSDQITASFSSMVAVNAGDDATLCEDLICLAASSQNCSSLLWQSDGDGTFDDPTSETTNYYPGTSDIQNTQVELCLTGYSEEIPVVSDCIEITIVPAAQLTMGVEQVEAAFGEVVPLVPTVAENLEAVLWFTTNGGGDFTITGFSSAIYNPSPAVDYVQGCIDIFMVGEPLSPCLQASEDDFEICFFGTPTVNAGDDATLCEDAINLSASSQYCTSVLWQSNGDGTFDDPTSETTNYYPGTSDIQNTQVELCLTGYSEEIPVVSDCIEITIVPAAQLTMGVEQVEAAFGEVVPLVPTVAENLEAVLWFTTNGGGDFTITGFSSAIYNPSPAVDYVQGCIDIFMVGEPLSPCLQASEDDFEICFFGTPTVNAGDDATLCEDAINLSASSQYCTSVLWQSNGDGTFDDPTSETTNYYPGTSDIQNTQVELCLTGYSEEIPVVSDCIEITIVPAAQLTMGVEQVEAAFGEVVPLVPTVAENLEAVLWFTTNGGGDFTITGFSSAIYNPSPAVDYVQGCIDIFMVGEPLSPCLQASEDDFEICFFGTPTVNAGDDATLCEDAINLSASSQYCTSVLWQSNGDGTFDDPTSETTNYYPGTSDIQNTQVELCLTGYSEEIPVVSDCIEITIVPAAQLTMGVEQVEAAFGEVVPLVPTVAENLEAVLWFTTNGGGDFTITGFSSAIYNPSPAVDYVQGCIEIYMVGEPLSPCLQASEDEFEICFFDNPTVNAGYDMTILEDETCQLNPQLSHPGTLTWTTSGDGTFDDPSSRHAEYFPGTEDISNGQADLSLFVEPVAPCTSPATDQMHLTILRVQTLFMPEGWSGISSYLQLDGSIVDMFAPVDDFFIIAQSNTGIYWPDGGLNTIGDFNNHTGYKVRMNADTELNLIGKMEDNKTVELLQGWNLLPILSQNPIYYYDLLDQMGDHLIVAKGIADNGIIWPDYNIYTLYSLQPGRTYLVALDEAVTFSFEDIGGEKSGEIIDRPMTYSPWTIQEKTSISHTIAIESSALDLANTGDFMGAFNQAGVCVGFSEIMDKTQNLAITVFGDEMISEDVIEGMRSGEQIRFSLYRHDEQSEHELEVTYNKTFSQANGNYVENGLSLISKIQVKSTAINETNASVFSMYPNPAKDMVNFIGDNEISTCHLTIHTINGLLMTEKDFQANLNMDLSDLPRGIYMVRMQSDTSNSLKKLILE